ncbi:MAG TPA: C-terminal binding protein [Chloroflexota bacterium]|nr:C-terminal binding protein [Chloroflexota bacterium]
MAQTTSSPAGSSNGATQKPKVVVLLGGWGNFGEVGERDILERAGCEVVVSEARTDEEMIEAARDADGIIARPVLSQRFMESLNRCKVIACSSIGMDKIEGVDVANEKGIVICNVPDVFIDEVANHTMALLLAAIRWVVPYAEYVKEGRWGQRGQGRPGGYIHRITGETLGLVGFGNISRAVAKRAQGFDMKVIAYDPYVSREVFDQTGVRQAQLGQVLQDSDFVSIHVPLLPSTHHLIGRSQLALMKKEAILVNTARGPVVDEQALIEALQNGQILGAGLDVTEQEPVDPENPLLKMPNVVITPHMASASDWAGAERRRRPAYEVVAVLTGHRPRAVWNTRVLERVALR